MTMIYTNKDYIHLRVIWFHPELQNYMFGKFHDNQNSTRIYEKDYESKPKGRFLLWLSWNQLIKKHKERQPQAGHGGFVGPASSQLWLPFPCCPSKKKTALLSIESWLFNKDPYFMVYYHPHITAGSSSSPMAQPRGPIIPSLMLVLRRKKLSDSDGSRCIPTQPLGRWLLCSYSFELLNYFFSGKSRQMRKS